MLKHIYKFLKIKIIMNLATNSMLLNVFYSASQLLNKKYLTAQRCVCFLILLYLTDNPIYVFSIAASVKSTHLHVSIQKDESEVTSSMISLNCTPNQNNDNCEVYLTAFVDREVCQLVFT